MIEPRQVKTIADAKAIVEQRNLAHVKVGVFDIDGIMRGKYMSRAKFLSALESGYGFCDVVLGWDCQDQLYDNVQFTGWHTGYPDAPVRILPDSCRPLPFEDDNLFFLSEFAPPAEQVCPRGILRRCWNGRAAWASSRTPASSTKCSSSTRRRSRSAQKHYRNLQPMAPGWFGYSVIRNSVAAEFYRQMLAMCETMDFGIEGSARGDRPRRDRGGDRLRRRARVRGQGGAVQDLHQGARPAQLDDGDVHGEVVARLAGPERTHSSVAALARRRKPVFHDASQPHSMSATMRHFVGGQQRLMPELLAMVAPTDQLLHASDSGILGADGFDRRRRESHVRAAHHSRAAPSRSASSIALRPRMRIRT